MTNVEIERMKEDNWVIFLRNKRQENNRDVALSLPNLRHNAIKVFFGKKTSSDTRTILFKKVSRCPRRSRVIFSALFYFRPFYNTPYKRSDSNETYSVHGRRGS